MKELKKFIEDDKFIDAMNIAFADLRADYQLDLDTRKEKITELEKTHVDLNGHLADLSSLSTKSSGLVTGLRGTGKTHLFLLARHRMLNAIDTNKTFCVYLNVKRLHVPEKFDQEILNRVFCIYLYNELSKQLYSYLESLTEDNVWNRFLQIFDRDFNKTKEAIEQALIKISFFYSVALIGSQKLSNLDKGNENLTISESELIELNTKLSAKLLKPSSSSADLSSLLREEFKKVQATESTYLNYLNLDDIRSQLVSIVKILNLNNLTIFIDEWEKLFYNEKAQEYLSFIVDRLVDSPLLFWIGAVPYRGQFHHLDIGADLPYHIDLDKSLIIENSKQDKEKTINYFVQFINNRLKYFLPEYEIDNTLLFNQPKKIELLVLGCMGNPRDFGTMFYNCWSQFKSYRGGHLSQGRPFKFISDQMIIQAIRDDGDKKFTNIKDDEKLVRVWHDLEKFAELKKSSHFVIEESATNNEALRNKLFSDLFYHRLLSLRKRHVPAKDTSIDDKLTVCALSYSCTYEKHTRERKFSFVVDNETIHDKVRRYIYDPNKILNEIRIKEGELFPCKTCGENINTVKMKGAWSTNTCPFCGGQIYNDQNN